MVEASDGIGLYAEAHGEGRPFVLSCAYCTTHENWRGQVEPLVAAGRRVVLWDYRGHGRSDAPDDASAYSIEQVVDDLRAVLDWAAPGERAVLGGLSFGGLCSLHFALRDPARVEALVLVDSGPGFKNPEGQAAWAAQVERTAAFLEKRGFQAFVSGKAGATCIGTKPELPAAKAAAAAIIAQGVPGIAHFGRRVSAVAPGVIDDLPSLEMPALVVVGEHDKAFLRAGEVMAAKLPNATHEVLPDGGHIVNIEVAEAFDASVIRFLSGLEPR